MFALASKVSAAAPLCGQVRGMATLKDISIRLRSVKNIQKITQSMKMVSAAKFAKSERELKSARPYGNGAQSFYEKAEVKVPESESAPQELIIAVTSDRGLCGGVHSNICKSIKASLADKSAADMNNIKIVCLGDKAKAVLSRTMGNNILMSFNELGKRPPSFADAVIIAETIMSSGYEFSQGNIVYNQFKTVVSYETSSLPIFGPEAVSAANKISLYDSLDSDVLQSYQEYMLASLIYFALKESATSEQSSRMTSMDNASKNAGEMIDRLTLQFNRTRQAVITRELIEIISGADAL